MFRLLRVSEEGLWRLGFAFKCSSGGWVLVRTAPSTLGISSKTQKIRALPK